MVLTVNFVWLKYVGMSTVFGASALLSKSWVLQAVYCYVAVLNGLVTLGFATNKGTRWLFKNERTGQLPWWSLIVWAGFCGPTWLYTKAHTVLGRRWHGVPEATEVLDGWWLGSRYADMVRQRPSRFAGVVDLTCELPERLRSDADQYKLLPLWDGSPPTPERIDEAARFAVACRKTGHVLIHCAHGRGRSTTVFVAALVRAKKFDNWRDAFAHCKLKRPCVKLNGKMRAALEAWQDQFKDLVDHSS